MKWLQDKKKNSLKVKYWGKTNELLLVTYTHPGAYISCICETTTIYKKYIQK